MDTVSKQRFEREVKTLSELNHPNIVKVFYWNVGGDAPKFTPYYIMEYLGGNSLRNIWLKNSTMMKILFWHRMDYQQYSSACL